jgi:hypothetical protein
MFDHLGPVEDLPDWAPLLGEWRLDADEAIYTPTGDPERGIGILMSPHNLQAGYVHCVVRIAEGDPSEDPVARIVLGYEAARSAHYSAGLGGFKHSYTSQEFAPGRGSIPLRVEGNPSSLQREREYEVVVVVLGQSLSLHVNGVEVLEAELPHPFVGSSVGLECWGQSEIHFSDIQIGIEKPKLFAVMEFGGPYDVLYGEVIRPVSESAGYTVVRSDDVSGPGIILEDIRREIREANIVIAEISPANRNVFYELGYAHALNVPTILLAKQGHQLPFDVSGYRCIFYDDSIGGKAAVEDQLRKHLEAVI